MSELATLLRNIQAREKSRFESDVKTQIKVEQAIVRGGCGNDVAAQRCAAYKRTIKSCTWIIKQHWWDDTSGIRNHLRGCEGDRRRGQRGSGDGWEGISQRRVSEDDKCEACRIRCHGYLCVYGEDCITLPDWCGTWGEKVDLPVHGNGSQNKTRVSLIMGIYEILPYFASFFAALLFSFSFSTSTYLLTLHLLHSFPFLHPSASHLHFFLPLQTISRRWGSAHLISLIYLRRHLEREGGYQSDWEEGWSSQRRGGTHHSLLGEKVTLRGNNSRRSIDRSARWENIIIHSYWRVKQVMQTKRKNETE